MFKGAYECCTHHLLAKVKWQQTFFNIFWFTFSPPMKHSIRVESVTLQWWIVITITHINIEFLPRVSFDRIYLLQRFIRSILSYYISLITRKILYHLNHFIVITNVIITKTMRKCQEFRSGRLFSVGLEGITLVSRVVEFHITTWLVRVNPCLRQRMPLILIEPTIKI
jgi:hypothetical protein